ncbi:MAG TPA: acyl-CoA synthetase [Pseudomonadales bacterium]|nr:acyl-CoA synthetase [Pseudomonadales bacterium]
MDFNVASIFERVASNIPDKEAIICGTDRLTYGEFDRRANRLARHLASIGIRKGDHVAIYAYNRLEWVEAMLACYKLSAVPVNVNYRYVEDELQYLLNDADVKAIVFERQFGPLLTAIKDKLPELQHYIAIEDGSGAALDNLHADEYDTVTTKQSDAPLDIARSGDDLYVLYTGGTTGMPKGVVWRQEDVIMALGGGLDMGTGQPIASAEVMADRCIQPNAFSMRSLQLAPLMHGAAQWGLLRALFEGATVVMSDKKSFDADHVWQLIGNEKVNVMLITGDAMARPLMDALVAREATGTPYDLSSMFVVASSAAIFSPSLKDAFTEKLPNVLIMDNIGASEVGYCGAAVHSKGGADKDAGGPRVAPGPDTILLDDAFNVIPMKSGQEGWLARGGNIPLAYYKDEEKTRKTYIIASDGRRYAIPGDRARANEDGTITLLGRGSGCINSGGEKIFPEEVEGAIKAHPAVVDTLVVGTPDERFGSCVTALVSIRPGFAEPTLESIQEACTTQIARYKLPRRVFFVNEIARSPSGKPDYKWAKEEALKQLG